MYVRLSRLSSTDLVTMHLSGSAGRDSALPHVETVLFFYTGIGR